MAIQFREGYSTLARYNGLAYIFGNSSDICIDEKENLGLWTTKYIGNELLLYKLDFTRKNKVVHFKETDPQLIASFNDEGEYTTGNGLTFMNAVFDFIVDKNPVVDFLRDSMIKNECLYELFFFNDGFAERVSRNRRNSEDNVPMNVLENILNNGLKEACVSDGFIRRSLTAYHGYLTHEETSGIQGRPWIRPEDILEIADRKLDFAPPATTTRSNNFIQK